MGYHSFFETMTPAKEMVNLAEASLYNQQQFASSMGTSFDSLRGGLSDLSGGISGISSQVSSLGSSLSGQMAANTAQLSQTFESVGAHLAQTAMQGAAMVSGATFISALTSSGYIGKAIQRQTTALKNELLELRSEAMLTRRAITAAQMLTFHELAELKVVTVRNHAETLWALMGQSEILGEIRELLTHPRRTEALELAKTGNFLMQRGLYQQARDALEEARKLIHDGEPGIAVSLAYAYGHLEDGVQAKERLHHALTLTDDPQFTAHCHDLLSDLHWHTGDQQKALEASQAALAAHPNDVLLHVNHAAMLAEAGQKDQSLAMIETMIEEGWDCAKPLLDRKSFYRHDMAPAILKLLDRHLDPQTEAMKDEIETLKQFLREAAKQTQTSDGPLAGRHQESMRRLETLEENRPAKGMGNWLTQVRDALIDLQTIQQEAAEGAERNRRFQLLTAQLHSLDRMLDLHHQRLIAMIPNPEDHPQVRTDIETIKTAMAQIDRLENLLACVELVSRGMERLVSEAEAQHKVADGKKIFAAREKRKLAAALLPRIASFRQQVERLRMEEFKESFLVCPNCFAHYARTSSFTFCGQCGQEIRFRQEETIEGWAQRAV